MNERTAKSDRKARFDHNIGRALNAAAGTAVFLAVLLFSAIAVIVLAIGAPLALGVSALAGGKAEARVRWRPARAT